MNDKERCLWLWSKLTADWVLQSWPPIVRSSLGKIGLNLITFWLFWWLLSYNCKFHPDYRPTFEWQYQQPTWTCRCWSHLRCKSHFWKREHFDRFCFIQEQFLFFSSAKIDLLVIATNLPRAYILPLKGLFVPTLTTILVSLQCTDTEMKK